MSEHADLNVHIDTVIYNNNSQHNNYSEVDPQYLSEIALEIAWEYPCDWATFAATVINLYAALTTYTWS